MKKSRKAKTSEPSRGGSLSAEERTAMKERARELKAAARGKESAAANASAVRAKFAEMPAGERSMAERLHAIILTAAPEMAARLWYGMPAYAKDGKIVCFFQSAQKFKTRYATLGFTDRALLDDGNLWPTAFALKALTAAEEAAISNLIRRALR